MDLNNVVAKLNFISSSVKVLKVECQMTGIDETSKIECAMDIKYSKPTIRGGMKIGKLLMIVNVSVKPEGADSSGDTIEMDVEGLFSSSEDTSDEEFLYLINVNGGAALYSIARSKLEIVSSLVYDKGKIVLPMINMIQFFEERKNKNSITPS